MLKKWITQLLSLGLFFSPVIYAGTTPSTLSIATMVSANCSLTSTLLAFGGYDPIGANASSPLNGSTTFQIACTKGANVAISMNSGGNSSNAQGTTRAMTDGHNHYLSYELYSNAGRNAVWSNSNTVSYIPTSSAAYVETVYGQIPARQNAMAGNYTDTITITATF